jgi:hypothetical protein
MPDESSEIVALLRELVELEKRKASQDARASRFFFIGIVVFFVVLAAIEQHFRKQIYEHYVGTIPPVTRTPSGGR